MTAIESGTSENAATDDSGANECTCQKLLEKLKIMVGSVPSRCALASERVLKVHRYAIRQQAFPSLGIGGMTAESDVGECRDGNARQ
jgi:hypothetical protein